MSGNASTPKSDGWNHDNGDDPNNGNKKNAAQAVDDNFSSLVEHSISKQSKEVESDNKRLQATIQRLQTEFDEEKKNNYELLKKVVNDYREMGKQFIAERKKTEEVAAEKDRQLAEKDKQLREEKEKIQQKDKQLKAEQEKNKKIVDNQHKVTKYHVNEYNKLHDEYDKLCDENKELKDENKELKDENKELKNKIKRKEEREAHLMKVEALSLKDFMDLQMLWAKLWRLENENKELKAKVKELENKNKELKAENKELEEQLQYYMNSEFC